jgi:GDP-L-fucose synthase
MNPFSWSSASVLLTGGHGFLGSHLSEVLKEAGCREITAPRIEECNLCDLSAAERLFGNRRFDIVFHLAASVGGIGANRARPADFFLDNSQMGLNLLRLCSDRKVGRLVFLGTICAYPKFAPIPFQETDLWNGYPEETNAPYGVAKRALTVGLQAYRAQYGLKYCAVFPTNLYGPRDNFDLETSHVIPAMIRKFEEARSSGAGEVALWGTGRASRDFLYVKDAARALLLAASEPRAEGETINLGSEREITIADLAKLIARKVGYQGDLVWDPSKPDGQPRRCVSTEKARRLLRFEPKTNLEEGIEETVAWYRANPRTRS